MPLFFSRPSACSHARMHEVARGLLSRGTEEKSLHGRSRATTIRTTKNIFTPRGAARSSSLDPRPPPSTRIGNAYELSIMCYIMLAACVFSACAPTLRGAYAPSENVAAKTRAAYLRGRKVAN